MIYSIILVYVLVTYCTKSEIQITTGRNNYDMYEFYDRTRNTPDTTTSQDTTHLDIGNAYDNSTDEKLTSDGLGGNTNSSSLTYFHFNTTEDGVTYVTLDPVDENATNYLSSDVFRIELSSPSQQKESIFMKFIYMDLENTCSEVIEIGDYDFQRESMYNDSNIDLNSIDGTDGEVFDTNTNELGNAMEEEDVERHWESIDWYYLDEKPTPEAPYYTLCGNTGMPTFALLFNSSIYVEFRTNHSSERQSKGFQFRYIVIPRNKVPTLQEVLEFSVDYHIFTSFV